jgi:hypothetical protein
MLLYTEKKYTNAFSARKVMIMVMRIPVIPKPSPFENPAIMV